MDALIKRLEKLEFQQKLLLRMLPHSGHEFDKLIIEKDLSEQEARQFHKLCERLNKEYEEQKAEGFVFYVPLFKEFKESLHPALDPKQVIKACVKQKLYLELMQLLEQNL
ncbi:DUF1878 family protein [Falsibacillus pallidus]|uniref:Uncharacterized protein DUF1878 n=1 Tax=Falsibacillus pallidus TaxID=493781 RepID=A0A370H1F3_9BACI|nr:DUF1878 family protein [Falsibacillus pallidus]RDI47873.1 uncharacterized protein DUF1878 [Falsibacillus pallidus]